MLTYLKQDWIDREIARTVERDRRGVYFHLFFGLFWCFLASWPTSVVEFAGVGLVITGLARALYIHRTWRSVGCHPLLWLIALWVGWQWLSVSWSPDPKRGLHELGQNRWVWSIWLLWTILPYRKLLIATVAAGFLCGHLSQVGHAIGSHFHISWLMWPRFADRNSGWWDPVIGGSVLTAALGLHLPCAFMGRGRIRLIAIAGSIITTLGIIATGTRGAWIASAALILIVATVAMIRWLRRRTGGPIGRTAVIGIAIVLAAALVSWLAAGDTISHRFQRATDEVSRAIRAGDYTSDTGARILMWQWAIKEVRAHPIRGVGAGGYQEWAYQQMRAAGQDPTLSTIHPHAHSAPLHIAATTGLVGLLLAAAVIIFALVGAFRGIANLGAYSAGPGFAIIGLMLAGLFDPVELNAQTAAMLALMLSFSVRPRPTEIAQSAEMPLGPPSPATRSM